MNGGNHHAQTLIARFATAGPRRHRMNHKRHKPRNTRAGCKMCKFWKVNGYVTERKEGEKFSDHRRRDAAQQELRAKDDPQRIFCQ